jgi:hypothetical protein
MASRRRAIVTVETRSLAVIRPASQAIRLWCQDCGAIVPMVTPEHAARLSGATVRAIYRRIEAGGLHFAEAASEPLLVCSDSLAARKKSDRE